METPTAPLFTAFMQDMAKQLVPIIVAELKHQTNAEGMGMIALDPNNLSLPVYTLVQNDVAIRDQIKDMIDDAVEHRLNLQEQDIKSISRKVDELDGKFDDLESKVDDLDLDELQGSVATLDEKVGELEENRGTEVDADDSDFQDAVRAVIRNHI
jgi:outer membrane murein-binding lipoprotein Lpp